MSWNFDQGGEKTEFTKFPVGVTRIRVIDESPHMRWTHWLPQFSRSVNCPGARVCPIDEINRRQKQNGEDPKYNTSRKFAMQILNRETGKLEIMEQGITFMEDLKIVMLELKDQNKTLADVDLKVRRTGTGARDTKYRIDIDNEEPISEGDLLLMENKLDLNEYFKPHTPEQIMKLLAVTENFSDAWVEITSGDSDQGQEEIEVR